MTGDARRGRAGARPAARRRRLPGLRRTRDRCAGRRRRERLRRALARRRRRRGQARLRAGARPLRARRAGRRELRRPRPAHRRARQRRPEVAVDGLPPDRAQALGRQNTTKGTATLADGLVADTSDARSAWSRTVELEPAQVGNGANELLDEVSKSKITGEEERYSHIDLLDFAGQRRRRARGVRRASGRRWRRQATPTWWPRSTRRFGPSTPRCARYRRRPTASSATPR